MNVALLSPLPPEQTGIADYAAALRAAIEGPGMTVSAPFQDLPEGLGPESIRRWITERDWTGIDLVHVELGGGRLREFVAVEALQERHPRLPVTATVHDPERLAWRPERLPAGLDCLKKHSGALYQVAVLAADPIMLRRERRVASRCQRLVTLTHKGALALSARMRVPHQKIVVIPHGNGHVPPRPMPSYPPLRALYFGFICRGKGIEDLIAAMAWIVGHEPGLHDSIQLTLAGGASPDMAFGRGEDYLAGIVRRIETLGLSDRIKLRIAVPAADIPGLIQDHHVMVLPYRESRKLSWLGQLCGTSGALSWANACGRGVLASDTRAFDEELARNNGRIFPPGNSETLAQCLVDLCRTPGLLHSWALAAQALGREREWSDVGQRFRTLWEELLKPGVDTYAS
ncbi:MAG: glycosyltransferase [Acidiferrobacteraceae bacterium]